MEKIYTVAHTHWDFEWYFTRQEAKVQFAFHMDEVLTALETNQLDFYTLDGQMAILDDYLAICPEKRALIKKFVTAQRLFIGPWYTQIDEMTTSGESIVRNLRLGLQGSTELGGGMRIGYLPDSFGQSQDLPKIYQGFHIKYALFWRGLPKEAAVRYFYWTSNDGSKVLTANLKNGYYAGVDLMEEKSASELVAKISSHTESSVHLLPVGGDQRAVDRSFKDRLRWGNQQVETQYQFIESNYPTFFHALEENQEHLPERSGEFIDPADSKIHRGIYASRCDLKQIYDHLERTLTYQLEPLAAMAQLYHLPLKQGLIDSLWKTVSRGQAHDSAGGCNSDKTNRDILMRGLNAQQEASAYLDYLVRKLSISLNDDRENEVSIWNPLPFKLATIRTVTVSTKNQHFALYTSDHVRLDYDIVEQRIENAALLRRDPQEMADEKYYVTTIAFKCKVPAMGRASYQIVEDENTALLMTQVTAIENDWYQLQFQAGALHLYLKKQQKWQKNVLYFEDSGDEGDTYDYSPAFSDWVLALDFKEASVSAYQGQFVSRMILKGCWKLPSDLKARRHQQRDQQVRYRLELRLNQQSNQIDLELKVDNQVKDHRLRLLLATDIVAQDSYADTPFGVAQRPLQDPHLNDWQAIGYKEEPTSLRPFLHWANIHSAKESWTFFTKGAKECQIIGEQNNILAITVLRGVGFLGRPDSLRRPGDASGLQNRVVPTPESQLLGQYHFSGSLAIDSNYDSQCLQYAYLLTTQKGLDYQTQKLNRFTTPLQYFPILPLASIEKNPPKIIIEELAVVFSSLLTTRDGTGFELRLYHGGSDAIVSKPGVLRFTSAAEVAVLDLEGKRESFIASGVQEIEMAPFKPGEIRTYGIYFAKDKEACND